MARRKSHPILEIMLAMKKRKVRPGEPDLLIAVGVSNWI
jgi:hypothetical protein